jgi:hypothetical protein
MQECQPLCQHLQGEIIDAGGIARVIHRFKPVDLKVED